MEVSRGQPGSLPCCPSPGPAPNSYLEGCTPRACPVGLAGSPWWPDHTVASTCGHFCPHLPRGAHRA